MMDRKAIGHVWRKGRNWHNAWTKVTGISFSTPLAAANDLQRRGITWKA